MLEKSAAAVHVDGLTSNGAGLIRAEEQCRPRNFVGGLPAALQDCVQKACQLVLGANAEPLGENAAEFVGHTRFRDRAGADGVNAHAFARCFGCSNSRQAEHAGLGRRVS